MSGFFFYIRKTVGNLERNEKKKTAQEKSESCARYLRQRCFFFLLTERKEDAGGGETHLGKTTIMASQVRSKFKIYYYLTERGKLSSGDRRGKKNNKYNMRVTVYARVGVYIMKKTKIPETRKT